MKLDLIAQVPHSLGTLEGPGTIGEFGFAVQGLSSFETILSWVIGIMTVLAGIYFIFILITGAYTWMSAGGDKNKLQEAQQRILNAIIGLVIVVAAYAIISLISYVTDLNILQPGELLQDIWP